MADIQLDGSSWITTNGRGTIPAARIRQVCGHADVSRYEICSIDIECVSQDGTFPIPERDPIVQIAMVFAHQDTEVGRLIVTRRLIISLGACEKPINAALKIDCVEFDDERAVLDAFAREIGDHNPDIIMGYNIMQFDLPYIYNRSRALDVFRSVGRVMSRTGIEFTVTQCNRNGPYGMQLLYECEIPGRVIFDMYKFIRNEFKYSSYKLDDVSAELLGDRKIDVHHSEIKNLSRTPAGRKTLADYCVKDAELPVRIAEKTKAVLSCIEMSRAVKVCLENVLYKWPQYRLYSAILREAIAADTIIPSQYTVRKIIGVNEYKTYRGAIVQTPVPGYYDRPVHVFDFASLYPSIMRRGNMCYSTYVPVDYVHRHADRFTIDRNTQGAVRVYKNVIADECGTVTYFVHADCHDGILPGLLGKFLKLRKETRALEKTETDPFMKSILDRRQLAMKVCANAVYGFTGVCVENSWLPCTEIAMSVTATGRDIITRTVEYVKETYKCDVIYGDTDSVMCVFPGELSTAEALRIGAAAETSINSIFDEFIRIEFECVYSPFLLVTKKRYAGLGFEPGVTESKKIVIKGLETKRRDNFLLLRRTIDDMMKMFLVERRTVDYVLEYVSSVLNAVRDGAYPIDDYIITKEIKSLSLQPHVVTARKMEAREPGYGPKVGSRVNYVITAKDSPGNKRVSDRADDPNYVTQTCGNLCQTYYSEKIKRTIVKTFRTIFSREHLQSIGIDPARYK